MTPSLCTSVAAMVTVSPGLPLALPMLMTGPLDVTVGVSLGTASVGTSIGTVSPGVAVIGDNPPPIGGGAAPAGGEGVSVGSTSPTVILPLLAVGVGVVL